MTSKTTLDRWWDRILDDHPRLRYPDPEHVARIFESRGISDDVWRARPYVPYSAGDWEAVLAADPSIGEMSPGRRAFLHKIVNQRPGLVMHRAGWEGRAPIVAQLRPFKFRELGFDVREAYGAEDEGVLSAIDEHSHASPVWHYHHGNAAVVVDRRRRTKRSGKPDEGFMSDHHERAHRGSPPPDGEAHPHFPDRSGHVARQHGGVDVSGRHQHGRFAKYVYPPGEEAARVDVHPAAWPLLEAGGDVAYFALEGLLKNDAILSTGAPVVNVGSVTLWGDRALGWLAETYLRRFRVVAVVPDSDAGGNFAVMSQARELAQALQRFGVARAVVAVPTAKCGRVCTHLERETGARDPFTDEPIRLPAEEHKRGVDDFLGAREPLSSLVVELAGDAPHVPDVGSRWDAQRRNRTVIEHVQATAGVGGAGIYPTRRTAEALGLKKDDVSRALRAGEDAGLLRRADHAAELAEMRERGEWRRTPALRVTLAPELHAEPSGFTTLGELLRS